MANIVNTQIVGSVAIPEYVKPAVGSIESETYRKALNDASNSFFNPGEEVQDDNEPSLKQRIQAFEGYTDENTLDVSRPNVSGTAKVENVVKSKL